MKKIITLLLLSISVISNASNPAWIWAKKAIGVNHDHGVGIGIDAPGNLYVIGSNGSSPLSFGSNVLLMNTGSFLVKYSPAGIPLWVKGFSNYAGLNSIATDPNGNSYICGIFSGDSLMLDTFKLFNSVPTNMGEAFVMKLNSSGTVLWAKKMGGTASDNAYRLDIDNTGHCYVTGEFRSPSMIFDATTSITYSGSHANCFVAKYDSLGNVQWARSGTHSYGGAISADASGNCYVTGRTDGGVCTFGSFTNSFTGFFMVKYDAAGNVVMLKSPNSNGGAGTGIGVDAAGNIYCTGYFSSSIIFTSATLYAFSSSPDIFIVKYDGSGNILWADRGGSDSDDIPCNLRVTPSGDFFIAGYFSGTNLILGTLTSQTNSQQQMFIAQYNTAGVPYWLQQTTNGGLSTDCGDFVIDSNGDSYITGSYGNYSTVYFDNIGLTHNANGYSDFCVAHLGNTTGIQPASAAINTLPVFPNPSTGQLFVTLPDGHDRSGLILNVYDVLGNCVITQTGFSSDQTIIEVQQQGVYFIELTDKSGILLGRSKFIRGY